VSPIYQKPTKKTGKGGDNRADNPHVNHVPVMTGGVDLEGVRQFYHNHLVGKFFSPDTGHFKLNISGRCKVGLQLVFNVDLPAFPEETGGTSRPAYPRPQSGGILAQLPQTSFLVKKLGHNE
jgi:hypothetical protein